VFLLPPFFCPPCAGTKAGALGTVAQRDNLRAILNAILKRIETCSERARNTLNRNATNCPKKNLRSMTKVIPHSSDEWGVMQRRSSETPEGLAGRKILTGYGANEHIAKGAVTPWPSEF
jgi:hypothetical protein